MIIRYKKNRSVAHMNDEAVAPALNKPAPSLVGPYASCSDCPYPSHGFKCFQTEGDCIMTRMRGKLKITPAVENGR